MNELNGLDAIHFAIAGGQKEMVKLLCDSYFQSMNCDNDNQTPLHYAVKFQNIEIVVFFLSKDSIVNANDNDINFLLLEIHHCIYVQSMEIW